MNDNLEGWLKDNAPDAWLTGVDVADSALIALRECCQTIDRLRAQLDDRDADDVVRRIERVLEAHDSDVFADFAAGNICLPTAIDTVI